MHIRSAWQRASKRQRIALTLVLIYLLYALLGYFLVSTLARDALRTNLSELTGQEVQVGEVIFNPFTLSVTVRDFAIPDPDGEPLVGFDEFYANFQLSSLVRWSWHFRRIAMVRPSVRLVKLDAETFNFSDLLNQLTDDSDAASDDSEQPFSLPRFSFHELALLDGDFRFRDEARAEPEDLALTPVSFHIRHFSTRGDGEGGNAFEFNVAGPAGGGLDWAGNLGFDPLVAHGRLVLSDVDLTPFSHFFREQVHFRIPSATLSIATDYHLSIKPNDRLQLSAGELVLDDLKITDPQLEQPVLEIPELTLADIRFDTQQFLAEIGRIGIEGLILDARLHDDGAHLVKLFTPINTATQADTTEQDTEQEGSHRDSTEAQQDSAATNENDTRGWQLLVRELAINEARLRLIDETLSETGELILMPVNLTLRDLAFHREEAFQLEGDLTIAETGQLALSGSGTLIPLDLELGLELSDLPLMSLAPWLRAHANIRISEGLGEGRITIQHKDDNGAPATGIDGSFKLTTLALTEADDKPLLGWSHLAINDMAVALQERELAIAEIQLDGPSLHLLTDRDGQDTISRLTGNIPADDDRADGNDNGNNNAAPWNFRLGGLNIADGELHYRDRTLPSPFEAGLHELQVTLGTLDSRSDQPAPLDLSAQIDRYSELTVKGQLQPLIDPVFIDLEIVVRDYGMNSLAPYTGKFLGHGVSSGRLDITSNINIDNHFLDSRSQIRAGNFFLGERVESEDAINVPIKLGLAVLRDRQGVIDLPVNARGDFSDPSVTVTGIILRSVTNVMVRAATAPFSILSSLVGEEELNRIDYTPGTNTPADASGEQLATLAALLEDRPTLKLNLVGSASEEDRLPLAARALGNLLQGENWQGLETALQDRAFRTRLLTHFEEQTGEPAASRFAGIANDESLNREERQHRLASNAFAVLSREAGTQLPRTQLEALAVARARHSLKALNEEHGIDEQRMAVVQPRLDDGADSAVLLELTAD